MHHSDDVARLINIRAAFNLSFVVAAAVLRHVARRGSNTGVLICVDDVLLLAAHSNNIACNVAVSCSCSIEPASACCKLLSDSDELESR